MKCLKRKISFFVLFFIVFMFPALLIPVLGGAKITGGALAKALLTGIVIALLATLWQGVRDKKKGIDCD